jgi:DNA (cytosine-5)-methyltransferase 1
MDRTTMARPRGMGGSITVVSAAVTSRLTSFGEKRMSGKRVYRFIDLFSGAGGLAAGFRMASDDRVEFRSVYAVEIDPVAAATYKANFRHEVFSDAIEKVSVSDLPHADIIIGGPPCQGFSPLGKMSPTKRHGRLNKLWRHYFRIVSAVRPQAFVIENVP